jgi:hypothetical protein
MQELPGATSGSNLAGMVAKESISDVQNGKGVFEGKPRDIKEDKRGWLEAG